MVSIGFTNKDIEPTVEASQFLLHDLECPPQAITDKTVVIFHDRSIFTANEDQKTQWAVKIHIPLSPKRSVQVYIMVSDFTKECEGYSTYA